MLSQQRDEFAFQLSRVWSWLISNSSPVQNPEKSDRFSDSRTSNQTWVSFEYNAGFAGVIAALRQVPGTYEQCLQGYGIFTSEGRICSNNRDTSS